MDIKWKLKKFDELTTIELYSILDLRNKIFVVEQNAIYLDTDCKDFMARHLMAFANGELVAYCRVFNKDDVYEGYASIGRVVVNTESRKHGLGRKLFGKAMMLLEEDNQKPIKIAAQSYLQKFYESFGFERIGDEYILEQLPHVDMICRYFEENKSR